MESMRQHLLVILNSTEKHGKNGTAFSHDLKHHGVAWVLLIFMTSNSIEKHGKHVFIMISNSMAKHGEMETHFSRVRIG